MNDYKLVKNTEWKDVEINGQVREIPLHWNISTIENKIVEYPPSKDHASAGNILGMYPFFNASQKQTMFCNDFSIDGEAIIITTGGDYAFSQYFNGKFSFSSHVWCFKLKEDNNKYFSYLFKYFFNEIQNLSVVGFKLKNLNKKDFRRIEFHFADIKEQNAIADILSNQESIIQDIEQLISKYESRFQYLSEELLSGKLRVKDVDGQLTLYKNADNNWREVEVNGEIKEIPQDWEMKTLNESINMEQNTKNSQIQNNKIQKNGKFPVIGQEVEFISGYIDDIKPLNASKENPTIIFGDHSCTLKFISFDYVLGGDGTKVFKGKNIETKFLFYSVKNMNFTTDGYKRHFSILKEKIINIPKENEQKLISYLLNQQEFLINQQKELLAKEKQKFDWFLNNLLSGKYLIKECNEKF